MALVGESGAVKVSLLLR
ncbi:hypothetical protein AAAC51_10490 [Priestia megaterium]